jgi:DNA processing protein
VSATACDACRARSALVAALSPRLDMAARRLDDASALLARDDEALLDALVPEPSDRVPVMRRAAAIITSTTSAAAVCPHADGYPPRLRHLDAPPATVYLHGHGSLAALIEAPCVAIVGARRASGYGLDVATTLARGLAAAGVTVVSGMALGVDAAAHRGALDAAGGTLAVLAADPERASPPSQRALHAEVAQSGLVVAELPPGVRPARWGFPARNRLIAGLAELTLVVEATERSGSLITAKVARELGRDVGAVPGRLTSALAAGCNALIRDGAHAILGAQDALDLVCGVGAEVVADVRRVPAEPSVRRALAALALVDGATVDELVRGGHGDARAVAASLAVLELDGWVRRRAGGVYEPLSPLRHP